MARIKTFIVITFLPAGVIKLIVYAQPQWMIELLVSKETMVLHRWESETKIWFYQTA